MHGSNIILPDAVADNGRGLPGQHKVVVMRHITDWFLTLLMLRHVRSLLESTTVVHSTLAPHRQQPAMPTATLLHRLQVLQSFYGEAFLMDNACIAGQQLRLRCTGAVSTTSITTASAAYVRILRYHQSELSAMCLGDGLSLVPHTQVWTSQCCGCTHRQASEHVISALYSR